MWCDVIIFFFFFFKQKTAYELVRSDWSSDVCSSDLPPRRGSHSTAGRASQLRGDLGCAVPGRTPAAVERTFDPVEDSRPRRRRRPRFEGDPRTGGKDPHLPARAGPPLPPKRTRSTGDGPKGVLQVAGGPLGPRLPRGS